MLRVNEDFDLPGGPRSAIPDAHANASKRSMACSVYFGRGSAIGLKSRRPAAVVAPNCTRSCPPVGTSR